MWTDEKALAFALVNMARSMSTHSGMFLMTWRDYAGWEQLTEEQAVKACDWLDARIDDSLGSGKRASDPTPATATE